MATIVFMPFHWAADMNASFALARKLHTRGHRIFYLTIPDTEDRIRTQGFDWLPVFNRVFPKGELAKQSASEVQGKAYGAAEFKARLRGMCELLRNDEISCATSGIHPDLFLVSSGMPWVGIAAGKTGVPVIQFSSNLISVEDWSVPPFRTNLLPDDSLPSAMRILFAWKKLFLRRRFRNRAWDISSELKALAHDCDFPLGKIDFSVETWPRLLLTELVFCPKDLDFPRRKIPEGAFFVEASIDVQRKDDSFPWSRLDERRPTVFCALGSLLTTKAAPQASRFFQMFLDAIRERPALQAVVAIGSYLKPEQFNCPANASLVGHAPQIELLKRCALMVGHGGLSSVKECIFMGVPMLLVPLSYDEPGNAARVVYHKIGLRLQLEEVSAGTLGSCIDTLLEDAAYRDNVRRMSQEFVEIEERSPACQIIEKALAKSSARF
ncbi:MAG TPA: glycosyltransferase [Candidatus Angelobacter sp.]